MNICIVAGARPNFIKEAPIIRALKNKKNSPDSVSIDYRLVYTGAKDDPTLEQSLFKDLQIPGPDAYLGIVEENLNELTGKVMSKFEEYLQTYPADVVIVVDDLASAMAVAIVTKKRGIILAHIAAGTRSFDISMPKEVNRLVIDGLSDILFTAGVSNNSIASKEGAELSKVYMVGNVLMDNIRYNHNRMIRPSCLEESGIRDGEYLVFTLNRKALITNTENLRQMLSRMLSVSGGIPIIAALHDSAKEAIILLGRDYGLDLHTVHFIEPLGYLEFGYLTMYAKGIITDSGNVAEEATFNQIPCITLNSYTEHIETITVGTNVLVGEDPERLAKAVEDMVNGNWKNSGIPDRWDGRSAERILRILSEIKSN
jgi:UDP-N-acetylglucosamine 2-epimerase (non-hydrolysing)